jgi:hypothetical protein
MDGSIEVNRAQEGASLSKKREGKTLTGSPLKVPQTQQVTEQSGVIAAADTTVGVAKLTRTM